MPFFVEVRGLKKIMTSPGRDRDWAKTAVGITGVSENFVRDSGIKEPYWGPSLNLQLAYDCRVRHKKCRRILKHVSKSYDNRRYRQC